MCVFVNKDNNYIKKRKKRLNIDIKSWYKIYVYLNFDILLVVYLIKEYL